MSHLHFRFPNIDSDDLFQGLVPPGRTPKALATPGTGLLLVPAPLLPLPIFLPLLADAADVVTGLAGKEVSSPPGAGPDLAAVVALQ